MWHHVKGICDRCGFERRLGELRTEWTGLKVCRECFDLRHPQEFVRGVKDQQKVPGAKPEPTPVFVSQPLQDDNFVFIQDENGQPILDEGS